ncbi:MAG: TonB family protein [Alistipes sp.]
MELKKTPKADLQNKRGLFLEIGLLVALGLTIGAFLYTPKEYRIEKGDMNYGPVEEEISDITRQDQKPPEPPKKTEMQAISDMLSIVKNDAKVSAPMTFTDFTENTEIVQVAAVQEEEIKDDEPFYAAETMPTFQGGDINAFRRWVQDRLKYPQIAQENGIQGKVTLQFVIEKDGRLTNIKILQSPDRSLAEEAIRVLNTSPKWKPGKQRTQNVRVLYSLPVVFAIQQ